MAIAKTREMEVEGAPREAPGEGSSREVGTPGSTAAFEADGSSGTVSSRWRIAKQPEATGGQGSVHAASNGTVEAVVKVIRPHGEQDAETRALRELEALKTLADEPHIIRVLDFGVEEGDDGRRVILLVLERYGHDTLESYARRFSGALPEVIVARLGQQLASALMAAHAKGIVHRDLKPENVLVSTPTDGAPRLKVIDFGIAHFSGAARITRQGHLVGSGEWAAPERHWSWPAATEPVGDVYSLGLLLLYLLTGEVPEPREGGAPVPAAQATSPELRALLERMLGPIPGDRPSAAEVHQALSRLDASLGSQPRGEGEDSIDWAPLAWAGGLIVALVLLAVALSR